MNKVRVREICEERCRVWNAELVERHATPVLMIAVGHDEQTGEMTVCAPEGGFTDADLVKLLRRAADLIEKGG